MSSLTIDLVLGLSKFEADSGKAAQIITRDSERMSRAAKAVNDALTKTADQAGRTQAEYLALAAAQAGLSETSQRLVTVIERTAAISAQVGAGAASGFGKASEAVQGYAQQQRALQLQLVDSILQVNAAYRSQREAIVAQQQSGAINTDQLKGQLAGLNARREEAIVVLKTAADEQRAALATAAAEQRLADQRAADARKLIDQQNGLTATYRQQIAALRELRDAGQISPAQFRQAGTELVSKQPVVQVRTAQADADASASARAAQVEADAVAKRAAAFEKLRNTVAQANFDVLAKQAAEDAVAESAAADATARRAAQFDLFRNKVAQLNYQQQAAAEEAAAAATGKRAEQTEKLIAMVQRLKYAQDLAADTSKINELRAAVALEDREAAQAAAQQTQLLADRAAGTERLISTVQKLKYAQDLAADKAAIDSLRASVAAENKEIASAAAANQAFTDSVQRQAEAIGKTRTELLAEEAARRGLTQQLQPYITKISEAEKNLNKFGTTSKVSQFQLQQLHYTLSDVIASLASGISPLTILAQQGGQVADAFRGSDGSSGIGNAFKAVTSLITPMRVALGLAGVAVGALTYAWYEGSKQSKEYADAIVLSGNAAGLTEGKYRELAKQISASGQVQLTSARAAALALAQTGEVGPQNFTAATEAVARYAAATGKTEKEVATDFASMSRGVGKWADDHNRQLNLITAAELQQIRTLEESGRSIEAQAIVYEKLNDRLRQLDPNLGVLERTLRGVKTVWNQFWDSAFDVGRTETIEQKIERARSAVANLNGVGQERVSQTQVDPQRRAQQAAADAAGTGVGDVAQENLRLLLRSKSAADDTAASAARVAELNKKAADADDFVRGMERRAKSADGLAKALAEANAKFADQDKNAASDSNYKPSSAETRSAILKKIREDFTDKPAIGEADQQRKALLDQDIKFIADQLQREKDALAFGQAQLNAQYNNGLVSLQEYYEQKRANISDGVQKELNALTDEQARLEVELDRGAFKDPHERTQLQTQLNESVAKSASVQRKAAQDIVLANYEQEQSLKQLAEQVNAYRASLFQAEGNDFAAAQLRQQEVLVRAKELAAKSGGAISDEDIARLARATQQTDEYAEIQRRVGIATNDAARAEEAYLLRAASGNATLTEQEHSVYLIRSAALSQLGELAEKARALADASTDPRLKAFAADLALSYARAADAVDPAIQRMRAAVDDLSSSISQSIGNVLSNSEQLSRSRAEQAAADIGSQQKAYDDQLKDLKGYLAQATDARQRALLQQQINEVQAKRDNLKVDNLDVIRKTLERDVFGPILKEIQKTTVKVFITDPLNDYVKRSLRDFTAGKGGYADILRNALGAGKDFTVDKGGEGINVAGAGYSAAKDSQSASEAFDALQGGLSGVVSATVTQTAATQTAASALITMTSAAQLAAQALGAVATSSGGSSFGGLAGLFGGSSNYSGVTAGIDYSGIGFPLADGTNYVPRDGFQATLHKGESVTPAKYNPAAGGYGARSGGADQIHIHNDGPPIRATRTETSTAPDGSTVKKIFTQQAVDDIGSGGPLGSQIQRKYGVQRQNPRRG